MTTAVDTVVWSIKREQ